jgi:hypothetical protein
MVHSLIFTGLLEMISNRPAGNAKGQGKSRFSMSKAIFMDVNASPTVGYRERLLTR